MINKQSRLQFIGEKIRLARQEAGLSQKELAEKIGFESATAVSLIEAGERKIGVVEMERIAKIFDQDIKYFLGEEFARVSTRSALRGENISEDDRKAILHILELAKNRHAGKNRKTEDSNS